MIFFFLKDYKFDFDLEAAKYQHCRQVIEVTLRIEQRATLNQLFFQFSLDLLLINYY